MLICKITNKLIQLYFLQEPKADEEIKEFLKQYSATFDVFSKIDVNGSNAIPLFKVREKKLPKKCL